MKPRHGLSHHDMAARRTCGASLGHATPRGKGASPGHATPRHKRTSLGHAIQVLTVAALTAAAGCNLLLPLTYLANPKKKVPAEYDKLGGKSALVLVWADQATLFDYPHIRMELATYVGDKLAAQVSGVTLVDPVRVADYQERMLDASLDPERTGRHFEVDAVVYLELLKFQIRDPNAPDLLRAQIEASVSVYDLEADPDERRLNRLTPAEVTKPKEGGVLFTTSNSIQVRQAAYVEFAEVVARKFYEHEEEY